MLMEHGGGDPLTVAENLTCGTGTLTAAKHLPRREEVCFSDYVTPALRNIVTEARWKISPVKIDVFINILHSSNLRVSSICH